MKHFYLALLIPLLSFGQRTYYGYVPRNNPTNQTVSCDDLLNEIRANGSSLLAFNSSYSSAISNIQWYNYEQMIFAVVTFTSSPLKKYLYGGWKFSYTNWSKIKNAYQEEESKGKFFNEVIKPATINCN